MALQPCHKCGTRVNADHVYCPHCGTRTLEESRSSRTREFAIWGSALAVVVLLVWGQAPGTANPAPAGDTSPSPSAVAPAISREQAQSLWDTGTAAAVVRRWNCDPQDQSCTFQVEPLMWARMEYDLKRDYVSGMGQAAGVLHSARRIRLVNVMTGAEVATYSAVLGTKIKTGQ
jgi:DNA-directed RNA polymerase subunit RPC12/RpoP